jgi:23S rRNA pseudouridine2605 synthase/16S rRNA pseudouridine516 synthase
VRERLQKILARAGYGSRRSCEAIITVGRVRVNGAVANELGASADPDVDRIEVDGKTLTLGDAPVYLAMHKPAGYVTTVSDPGGRPTVMSLLPRDLPPHVFPVGRLDRDTEGLLLFTNDGEFGHRLAHPRYEIEKEYLAMVTGVPPAAAFDRLRRGVVIEGSHRTAPARVALARAAAGHTTPEGHSWLRLVIHEGRKRQVRLMCAAVGHQVRALVRTRVGSLRLGALRRGKTRRLTKREIDELARAVDL